MGKNVIPIRRRKGATDTEKAASRGSRIMVRVGKQRYAIDIAAERKPRVQQMERKFLRLRQPATL
jgi:hypothetical protein